MTIPIGSLIITKQNPSLIEFDAGFVHLFNEEKTGKCYGIPVGACGLVVGVRNIISPRNYIIDVLFGERILSIADYNDQHGNPVWCDIL